MTGHGQASTQNDQVRVVAEVRTVNNRFLKTSINCDLDAAHQSKLESLIKKHVRRGSVNLRVKTQILESGSEHKLNEAALRSYWLQLSEVAGNSQSINIESLLLLPGVVETNIDETLTETVWPLAKQAAIEALESLNFTGLYLSIKCHSYDTLLIDQLKENTFLICKSVKFYL